MSQMSVIQADTLPPQPDPHPETATAADGTHPTGMLSFWVLVNNQKLFSSCSNCLWISVIIRNSNYCFSVVFFFLLSCKEIRQIIFYLSIIYSGKVLSQLQVTYSYMKHLFVNIVTIDKVS